MKNEIGKKHEKSCCTWPKILVTASLVVITGVLIWQFAPIEEAIDSVLPTFNHTEKSNNDDPNGSFLEPTLSPSATEKFQFMHCDRSSENCCNGLETICDFRLDEILYASVHNAMATFEDGFLFGPNHLYKLEGALDAGYRGIGLGVCNCGGIYQFCRDVCSLGVRDITEVFTNINLFLDKNPTEVIIVKLQINNNADQNVDLAELYGLMTAVRGFSEKIYKHPNSTIEWPTLREVVRSNERIIMFHYGGQTCMEASPCPPGLYHYPDYATENSWEAASLAKLRETSTSCQFQHQQPSDHGKKFFGLNNYVTPPSQTSAQTANSLHFLKNRLETCSKINENEDVNFIYVDFWFEGNLPQLTQEHNTALAELRLKGNLRRNHQF